VLVKGFVLFIKNKYGKGKVNERGHGVECNIGKSIFFLSLFHS
jgi:hypothetical protein